MDNFNHLGNVKLIQANIADEFSNKEFQEFFDGKELAGIYKQSIIPLHQALVTLHKENKITTEQFNKRLSSIMKLLRLIKNVIARDDDNKIKAIFLLEDVQQSPFYLNVLLGLLRSENVYPVIIESPITTEAIQQVINNYKADSLFLLHPKNCGGLISLPPLNKVRFRILSYPEIQQLIDSLPTLPNKSIRIYDWLCGKHPI